MKKILTLFLLSVFFCLPLLLKAQETSIDIGPGAILCEKYAKRPLDKKNDFILWVQGFFSAFNALDPNIKNIADQQDFHAIRVWLDDYCKNNPQQYFGEALRAYIDHVYPPEVRNPPPPEAAALIKFEKKRPSK